LEGAIVQRESAGLNSVGATTTISSDRANEMFEEGDRKRYVQGIGGLPEVSKQLGYKTAALVSRLV
jgi:hypothetical protein